MSHGQRTVAGVFAALASCKLARVSDRLLLGDREAAEALLAEALQAVEQVRAAMGGKAVE